MTEQEKKKQLFKLKELWKDLYRKRRRYRFILRGIESRMEEVEKEINEL